MFINICITLQIFLRDAFHFIEITKLTSFSTKLLMETVYLLLGVRDALSVLQLMYSPDYDDDDDVYHPI